MHRGALDDPASLRSGAAAADAVIHLAFIHDFTAFSDSLVADRGAIEAFGDELAGSDRPLSIASGTLGVSAGQVATEHDTPGVANPRHANAQLTLALAERGVRSSVVRLSPTVHGRGDHGFVPRLIDIARERGVSGYIGDGTSRWTAVHRLDAAALFRLAIEKAPAGSVLHGVAEEGIQIRAIAEVIGAHLDLPVVSVPPAEAEQHFGWLGGFLGLDSPASNTITRELLGWEPVQPGLIADLDEGHYFG